MRPENFSDEVLGVMLVRKFYLSKNSYGYYRVNFIDPATGKKLSPKSTHTKDKIEAAVIATKWLEQGITPLNANSRLFKCERDGETLPEVKTKETAASQRNSPRQEKDLQALVDNLTLSELKEVVVMIAKKIQIEAALPTGVPAAQQTVQQTIQKNVAGVTAETQNTVANQAETILTASENKNAGVLQPAVSETVSNNGRIPLVSYLVDFWDFKKSKFLAEEKAYGRQISERHAKEMRGIANRYWKPYFGEDRFVDEISKNELEEFFLYLRNERGLSGGTVNLAMCCGSKMYRYLSRKELIAKNPFENLSRFSVDKIKRGIPTETEVAKLMNLEWENKTSKLAFCIGAFAGLRAGEISGLRVCDLDADADIIHVRHTWNDTDGLKSTKNTDTRDIPVDHDTMTDLVALARRNKQYSDLSYVFWSTAKPEQPFNPGWYQDGFYDALEEIGISEEQRKERVIVFHSLRHFCATLLRQRADLTTVQTILGHRTEEMTEHYSSHWSESQAATMKSVMSENKKHILNFLAA